MEIFYMVDIRSIIFIDIAYTYVFIENETRVSINLKFVVSFSSNASQCRNL